MTATSPAVARAGQPKMRATISVAAAAGSRVTSSAQLASVSCATASSCMAVGNASVPVSTVPFSQMWSGGSWRTLAVMPRVLGGQLTSVSCPRTATCVTVGYQAFSNSALALSYQWNGTRWHALPPPAEPAQAAFSGVWCGNAASCIAVGGSGGPGYYPDEALAELWNGTAWTRLKLVIPAGATHGDLSSISCSSATSCMAVGWYYTGYGGSLTSFPLAESWDGSSWTMLPAPAGAEELASVSCPGASTCIADGLSSDYTAQGFSAEWNGSGWTTLTLPASTHLLGDISCASITRCVAVGGLSGGFAEAWTGGTSWSVLTATSPGALLGISCASSVSCLAVGDAGNGTLLYTVPFAESWNGSSWQAMRTEHFDALLGVSCAAGRCLAVGSYNNHADYVRTFAQAWNGSRWQSASPPGRLGALGSVSCAGASYCVATPAPSDASASAESWNGTRWRKLPGTGSGVSCPTTRFCMVVGSGGSDVWNRSTWTHHPLPEPAVDVSCTGPSYCMAVGSQTNDNDNTRDIADVWDGLRWRRLKFPPPGLGSVFDAVSCVPFAGCMAVGQHGGRHIDNFADWWNGTKWRLLSVPGGVGYTDGNDGDLMGLADVSCTSAFSCMAVGNYIGTRTQLGYNLAVVWNGSTWRLTRPVGPGGGLAAVSCMSVTSCIAVGQAGLSTLAERWNGALWSRLETANP